MDQSPGREDVPVTLKDRGDGNWDVTFTPEDVGEYEVRLRYGGRDIRRRPHGVTAVLSGAADRAFIMDGIRSAVAAGEEYAVTVNVGACGKGALTARLVPISPSGSRIPVEVEMSGDGIASVYYSVKQPGQYRMQLKFGGALIPKGDWTFTVYLSLFCLTNFELRAWDLAWVRLGKQAARGGQMSSLECPSGTLSRWGCK